MNKLKIRKLGILSVAKIYAVMMLVMSLLFSIPYGLIIIIFSLIGGAGAGSQDGLAGLAVGGTGVVFGIVVMIALPIIYGILGFVMGALSALVYNIFAGMVGGIEIEVENVV
ncbi:MAG: hypothetical protein HKN25_08255 [Pyrinomonadaceae bacterium]|nr:hypothetical protein [Pyrinomonadaceae bacterium]